MDIGNKVFAIEKKGYSVSQVDSYLKMLADEAQKQNKAMAELVAKNEELSARIEEYKIKESAIKDVLLAAHKTADSMIEEAKEQAALLETQAKLEYARITEETAELKEGFAAYQKRLIEYVDKQKNWLLKFADYDFKNADFEFSNEEIEKEDI